MKSFRASIIGLVLAMLVTVFAGGLWATGREDAICIVLWPGMMLGWAFVFGDNIQSFHDVTGVITLISVVTNGVAGLILGANAGIGIKIWKRLRQKNTSDPVSGGNGEQRR